MFEVYSIKTGRVIQRCRDVVKANQVAINYTSTYAWIDGDKFDYRAVTDENSDRSFKREQATTRLHGRSREEADRISLLRHIS